MQEEFVELIPEGLTRGVSLHEAYFLMLREKGGKRFLPSLLEEQEFELVLHAIQDKQYTATRLMSRLAHRFSIQLESVHVFYPPHGNLSAALYFKNGDTTEKIACNIAEGISAALNMECPILMERNSFNEQVLRQQGEGQVSMPITAMNNKLLEEALRAAVDEDNFELASVIRDELQQREKFNGSISTEQF